jgi:hypothetical protein
VLDGRRERGRIELRRERPGAGLRELGDPDYAEVVSNAVHFAGRLS